MSDSFPPCMNCSVQILFWVVKIPPISCMETSAHFNICLCLDISPTVCSFQDLVVCVSYPVCCNGQADSLGLRRPGLESPLVPLFFKEANQALSALLWGKRVLSYLFLPLRADCYIQRNTARPRSRRAFNAIMSLMFPLGGGSGGEWYIAESLHNNWTQLCLS